MSLAGIDQYATCISPTLFCIRIVFNFSWDGCNTQEKIEKQRLCQFLGGWWGWGGGIRYIMGNVQVTYREASVKLLLNGTVNASKTERWWGEGLNELTFGLRFVSVMCTVTSYQSKNFLTILITVVSSNWSRMNPCIFSALRWNCLNCGFSTLMLISSF